ncbi:MAG: sulfite exporter TauE/SafE family protein [Betaproteobacteria bacterium]
MTPETTLLAVFLAGLLGGGHCAGMCGGIVGALSSGTGSRFPLHLAYNGGRIASYSAAGAVAGALGGMVLYYDVLPLQLALYVLANLMLILLGLYLAGWSSLVTRLEAAGRWLWREISPLTRRFLPVDTMPRAFAVGTLWGWLPCGLTYGALAIALVSAGAANGALLMLAFGLGTLPNLLLAGLLLRRARSWFQGRVVRWVSGGLVLGFGIAGLANAAQLADQIRRGVLCLV